MHSAQGETVARLQMLNVTACFYKARFTTIITAARPYHETA
jgi:hypothetical protein